MIQGLHLLKSFSMAELLYRFAIPHLLNGHGWIDPIHYSLSVPLRQSSLIALCPPGVVVRFVIPDLVYSLAKITRPAVLTSMGN